MSRTKCFCPSCKSDQLEWGDLRIDAEGHTFVPSDDPAEQPMFHCLACGYFQTEMFAVDDSGRSRSDEIGDYLQGGAL
jgi:hypothetical protein